MTYCITTDYEPYLWQKQEQQEQKQKQVNCLSVNSNDFLYPWTIGPLTSDIVVNNDSSTSELVSQKDFLSFMISHFKMELKIHCEFELEDIMWNLLASSCHHHLEYKSRILVNANDPLFNLKSSGG